MAKLLISILEALCYCLETYWGTGFRGAQLNWEAFGFLEELLRLHRT